jgi:hypothetical protein
LCGSNSPWNCKLAICIGRDHRENIVQRIILGTKRDEILGGWKIMHNEEHHFQSSSYIIRMIKSGG